VKKIAALMIVAVCATAAQASGKVAPQPLVDASYQPVETAGASCADQEKLFLRLADETAHHSMISNGYIGNVVSTTVIRSLLKHAADTKDRKLADFAHYLATAWTNAATRYQMAPIQAAAAASAWCRHFEGYGAPLAFVATDGAMVNAFSRGATQCIGPFEASKACFRDILLEVVK